MSNKKIIDKIKKLLRLGNSTNANEAALAIHKAKELMTIHGIDQQAVDISDVQERFSKRKNKSIKDYEAYLVQVVAECFGCEYFLSMRFYGLKLCPVIVFVGLEDHVELATYCYEVLAKKLTKARSGFVADLSKRMKKSNKTKQADIYTQSWVKGVTNKIELLVPKQQVPKVVQQYMQRKQLQDAEVKKSTRKKKITQAHLRGYVDGQNTDLYKPMQGSEGQKIIQ